jgi:hypothetical protein
MVAVLSDPSDEYPAVLLDISRTGARMGGTNLPPVGQQVIFRAENVCAFGEVVWREANRCAIEFETPIAAAEVQHLRCIGSLTTVRSAA